MDECYNALFLITGGLIGVGFTSYVCWAFLLEPARDRGKEIGYALGWDDAYKANAHRIPTSMSMWKWPGNSEISVKSVRDATTH